MKVNVTIWYEALASEFGIIVESDNPEQTRQRLYALRKESNDADLDCISIMSSPLSPTELWLVKRKP